MRLFAYYTTNRPPRRAKTCSTPTPADAAAMSAAVAAFAAVCGAEASAIGHDDTPGPRRDFGMILDVVAPGDVFALRSLDDVVTLAPDEWARLRRFARAGLRVVVLDVPETHPAAAGDLALAVAEATARASIARRRARQREGVTEALKRGAFARPRHEEKRAKVRDMLATGATLAATHRATGASLWLVRAVRQEIIAADAAEPRS